MERFGDGHSARLQLLTDAKVQHLALLLHLPDILEGIADVRGAQHAGEPHCGAAINNTHSVADDVQELGSDTRGNGARFLENTPRVASIFSARPFGSRKLISFSQKFQASTLPECWFHSLVFKSQDNVNVISTLYDSCRYRFLPEITADLEQSRKVLSEKSRLSEMVDSFDCERTHGEWVNRGAAALPNVATDQIGIAILRNDPGTRFFSRKWQSLVTHNTSLFTYGQLVKE